MSGFPPIKRPDGSLYRPRKLSAVPLGDQDECTGIVVFGTQDVDVARGCAETKLTELSDEFYSGRVKYRIESEGERVWLTQRFTGFDDRTPLYVYNKDPEHGRGGIEFDVEEYDVNAYELFHPADVPGQTAIDTYPDTLTAALADPEGQALVQAILDRRLNQ